jgi:hypothetical protein
MLLLTDGQVTPQPDAKGRLVAGTAPGDVLRSGCGKHVPGAATGVPAVNAGPEAYRMATWTRCVSRGFAAGRRATAAAVRSGDCRAVGDGAVVTGFEWFT